jgi:hypothetical protein
MDTRWVENCQNSQGYDFENSYPQLTSYFASLDTTTTLPNIERLEMLTSMDRDPVSALVALCHQCEI